MKCQAAVVGGGPAGLMAAEVMAEAGLDVCVFDAKPSMGRKLLMAGKSGLNLTKDVGLPDLLDHVSEAELAPMLEAFDAVAVQAWARGLGQDLFTGSTGRVFPRALKASPLLRAWLERLAGLNVTYRLRWRWVGFDGPKLLFETPDGDDSVGAEVVVFALGGASWARLGSDGKWAHLLPCVPFQASNAALSVAWSEYMRRYFGTPLKAVAWRAGDITSRGEAVVSEKGLEGGGIYSLSSALRRCKDLEVDLKPDLSLDQVTDLLSRPKGKASVANRLRKVLRLEPVKLALLQEMGRPLPQEAAALGQLIKGLTVRHQGLRPLDEAISTVGGVPFSSLDETLMLRDRPGVFCAGEMLDWDAPTGGYLLTSCFATGRWAGKGAADWVRKTVAPAV